MLVEQDMPVADAPDDEGDDAPRRTFNFAPGYHGLVYRADTSDRGAGSRHHRGTTRTAGAEQPRATETMEATYKLQSMKWGLVPFWTKRNPDYGTIMKAINCRDDSLSTPGGMWSSMKARKRCIVIAEGFFEWLKTGPKNKLPHYIKRRDGQLMCFAGLWDCVEYEDTHEKTYTYTIITTDANKQMRFIHDRMPVVLDPGSDHLRAWLDPEKSEWSKDLQSILKPYRGDLEIYPVNKDVGKVGNNSPSFVIPLDSKENKSNIANFFGNASKKSGDQGMSAVSGNKEGPSEEQKHEHASEHGGVKRKASEDELQTAPAQKTMRSNRDDLTTSKTISAVNNNSRSPNKVKPQRGTQKITQFFKNSA
ncbi:putative peptidase-like protein [Emericellopsis cladophorae]|uniref:Peptidase-like protein n=1 Tax=Emericellopsis cladophorae TaxID=2686198 RepID=A0A9P9XY55_9HYPO|nr:putative peptidase-like protein [Emericellopsis cladophorae]KAI6779474.1 putative peptidase-like protein [Emericellopsis cladophorae]